MMNYIKSELYRVSHSREFYYFTGSLTVLAILFNAILGFLGIKDGESFPYNTTSFSYSTLVASPMLFCAMGAVVGVLLYEGNRKNGNLKNTIAFGISRIKIFAGECIVSTLTASISLIVVLTVYIASAVAFCEHAGPVSLNDLTSEVLAVFLLAVASLISGIVCIEAFGKASTGIIIWVLIWFVIPKIFFFGGFYIDLMYKIAMWMPENFFGTMIVNMSQSVTAWGTSEGMAKCLISGGIGIIVFSLSGVILLRKREL